jgi:hypothetical protein
MKIPVMSVGLLLLLSANAFAQSYEMTIHLRSGETVTISHDLIRRIEFAGVPTGAEDPADPGHALAAFQLLQNYPNPFNPSTTIAYELPNATTVRVRLFDPKGALIRELLHETQSAGRHELTWDGTDGNGARVSSGVYFYAVDGGGTTLSQRLILVK